jgi:LPS sulfotransferase NodH
MSYLICATLRSGSTLLCDALEGMGVAGCPAEHFEVLLETGQPRQPRDYFQRSNDPEVWALLDDPGFRDVLGEYRGRHSERPARRDPQWRPPDFEALVEDALREGTTENGVLGTKIMWAYFRDFVRLARRRRGLHDLRPCEVPGAVCRTLGGSSGSIAGTPPARRPRCGRRCRPGSGVGTPTRTSWGRGCASASRR